MLSQSDVVGFAANAGLEGVPLAFAAFGPQGLITDHAQGRWRNGSEVVVSDHFYGASLTKQVTGTAIALLVRDGRIDVDTPLGRYLVDLPVWRSSLTIRQVLHHVAGLPEAGDLERRVASGHWTNARVLHLLKNLDELPFSPGAGYHYSNAGYICLAAIVEIVSGISFSRFAQEKLFQPFGLEDMAILPENTIPPFPQRDAMGGSLPLTTGDGGLWTTAAAFARWLDLQNRDGLHVGSLLEQPGRLADGSNTDYGWGVGLRSFRGWPMFIHGGGWQGASAKAVRCPDLGLSVVALTAEQSAVGVNALVNAALNHLADRLTALSR